jgi:hypothetical protein
MTRITGYTSLAAARLDDVLPLADIHDLTMAPTGTTKKITIAALLASAGYGINALDPAIGGAADSTGSSPCDSSVQQKIAALNGLPGAVLFPPGTYKYGSGVTSTAPGQYLQAIIPGTVTFNYLGSGDCVRMYSTTLTTPGGVYRGGVIGDIIIDGSGAGAGASGVHAGDILGLRWDCRARNFQGAGSKGFWFDNQYHWAEQMSGQIFAEACSNHVVFDNSTGTSLSASATGSFDRPNLDIWLDGKGKGDLVTFQNGAFMVDGRGLGIHGNTDYGTSQFWVLTLTGSNAGGYSLLRKLPLYIDVECNGTTGTQPGTIRFGTPGSNGIFDCTGLIDFAGNNPFASAGSAALQSFAFDGGSYGDNNLWRSANLGALPNKVIPVNGTNLQTKYTSAIKCTPAGAVNGLILQGFAPDEWARPVTVFNDGAGSMTFAASGTSHVADGTADVIQPNTCRTYRWSVDDGLWYPSI